ncbi:hypothetical protein O181_029331 [Austropuccinia psidii MF-1]|uniref:Uncharacterized protein n=1 Tax=Austropuccinia psidii MF-1 TaxID=1389203 RepID=A0A9Q3CQU7_9BASI|nr:hypothetical protein [Austropuccinia psidii MF-1]
MPTSPQGQMGDKPQLGPPEPFLAPNPIKPKMAIKTLRTHFAQGSLWSLVTARGHQISSAQSFPSTQGGLFPFLHASRTQGCRSGA